MDNNIFNKDHLYNLGDKFIIEISSVMLKKDGTYAYGIKKVKNLTLDEKVLEALPKLERGNTDEYKEKF